MRGGERGRRLQDMARGLRVQEIARTVAVAIGIAEDTLIALGRLFRKQPGGLLVATLALGSMLSAITGFVSASVITMGLIALPTMLKAGYDPKLATGSIAAAGTLAQMLPPSLVLIVLAEQVEVPLVGLRPQSSTTTLEHLAAS